MATEAVKVGEPVTLCVRFTANVDLPALVIGVLIKDRLGQEMYGINTHRLHMPIENLRAGSRHEMRMQFVMNLGEGHYSIATALTRSDSHLDLTYEWKDRVLIFHVMNVSHPKFVGRVWLPGRRASMTGTMRP